MLSFNFSPRQLCLRPKQLGFNSKLRATATQERVFTDQEWDIALKEAIQLNKAVQLAAEDAGSNVESVTTNKDDKIFSDEEWSNAISEALKAAAMASASASAIESVGVPAQQVPEGRVFSDEQWSKAISEALIIQAKLQDAEAGNAVVTDKVFEDQEWTVAIKVALEMDLTEQETEIKKNMDKQLSVHDAMSFNGPAPERINGRLAMLGIVSALAAEIASNQSIGAQISAVPIPIAFTFLTFMAASLIPLVKGVDEEEETIGPFTPSAEILNGRLAMVGMAALIFIEANKGGPFL
eukprot:TRINITY_DN4344_c0_g2_i2.p1 TRINITY_DN4344_c0_g2~~TRINITY_DN4344_c0_g2_i2.p1  ORF type:complete len:295 (+),score=52.76 TRINITY_DN4344_c0_g2_i2:113-997(+)